MDKENIASASASRRSALIERIRIREEWSALKGVDPLPAPKSKPYNKKEKTKNPPRHTQSDALRGVVALVSVGVEARALPLRAALTALGATVVSQWNALVTHLVWAEGGCRAIRAKARLLASNLVSPLWVEACAAAGTRLPERAFPAAARDSDLPSPRTLRRLLKRAELENIPLVDLLTDSNDSAKTNGNVRFRLRISSDKDTSEDTTHEKGKNAASDRDKNIKRNKEKDILHVNQKDSRSVKGKGGNCDRRKHRDNDTSRGSDSSGVTENDTSKDTTRDKITDTSRDTTAKRKVRTLAKLALSVIQEESCVKQETTSQETENMYLSPSDATDVESRVNTAKRRALPVSVTPQPTKKSRRKLFTQKEVADDSTTGSDEETTKNETRTPSKMTQRERKILARAERMAQRMVKVCAGRRGGQRGGQPVRRKVKYYLVLTGMSRSERHLVCDAVRKLGGRIQTHVNRKTTHVLLGSCRDDRDDNRTANAPHDVTHANEREARNIEEIRNIENARVGRDITNSMELDEGINNDRRIIKERNEITRSVEKNLVQTIRKNIERSIRQDDIVIKMGTMNIDSSKNKSNERDSNDVEIVNNNNVIIDIVTDSNNSDNNRNVADKNKQIDKTTDNITVANSCVARIDRFDTTLARNQSNAMMSGVNLLNCSDEVNCEVRIPFCDVKKARTLNALLGAARGCRVLYGQWALDSLAENHWIHHQGYEVKHLKKVSQNARVERTALERTHSEYGYDVFNGIRIKLSTDVEQKNAVIELLTLCGGIIINPNGESVQNGRRKIDIAQKNRQNCVLTQLNGMTQQHIPRNEALTQYSWLSQDGAQNQDGGRTQNGGRRSVDYDVLLGTGVGEISSKWVFDSVATGRMRTIRRYINKERS